MECAHCNGLIDDFDGIWMHTEFEDYSHLARPAS